jgi:hypothetical protein
MLKGVISLCWSSAATSVPNNLEQLMAVRGAAKSQANTEVTYLLFEQFSKLEL